MSLRFFNTLTQKVEEFVPAADNTVRMYTCGPTVYSYAHIGNFRSFTFYDLLRRWLRARGFGIDHVMNITDVEDKIIRGAMAEGKSIDAFTASFTQAFREDCDVLRLQPAERVPKATEHIPQMAEAIRKLGEKGYTYQSDGSVYYRISKFPEYGKLSHRDFSGIQAGARVDLDEYEKDDARDFVLWKAPKEGEPFWETEVGRGRPGWHIECSVMAIQYLGETLDIHAGGIDLTFPHHENEIAQAEALTGKPFARFWMHAEFLLVEGQKMSKSLGNYYTLRDVLARGYQPEAVRYLLASVPYRKQLNFTFDGLKAAAAAIERLRSFQLRLDTGKFPESGDSAMADRARQALAAFDSSLDDDLNTAEALGAVFELVRVANTAMAAGGFPASAVTATRELLARFDSVFDVLRPTVAAGAITDADVEARIAERIESKKARDFARADAIRKELLDLGVVLEDTKDGARWKRK